MSALLSVIIPAYNAELVLGRAIDSLLSQTLRDISILIVDDGSTDGTLSIARRFASYDRRVRVIHQHNCGAFGARVIALTELQSEYFGFIDADDWVEPSYYERMVEFARANKLDVVQAIGDADAEGVFYGRQTVRDEVVLPWLVEGRGSALVWDKIYSRKCATAQFDRTYKASLFEDMVMNFYFFEEVESFGRIYNHGYHYCPGANSSTKVFKQGYIHDFLEAIKIRRRFVQKLDLNEDSAVNADWVVKNACNIQEMIINTSGMSLNSRIRFVRELGSSPEVRNALASCKNKVNRNRMIMSCRWTVFVIMITLCRKIMRQLFGCVIRRMR